jgi:hypothetical protein
MSLLTGAACEQLFGRQARSARRSDDTEASSTQWGASVDPTNVASLRVWWSVRNAVHVGEGMRLPALHSGGQVSALGSDQNLSLLRASRRVARSAAGLL